MYLIAIFIYTFLQEEKSKRKTVAEILRIYVNFFVLARNRLPPGGNVDAYLSKLEANLPRICLSDRADFLFFFVMFDFHAMLPDLPPTGKVFPRWFKYYRHLISCKSGIPITVGGEWQSFMTTLVNLPSVLQDAMRNICDVNAKNNIATGTTTVQEALHIEYCKLWIALRYNYRHWTSVEKLCTLMAELPKDCNYEVPLFSLYSRITETPHEGNSPYRID